MTDVGEKYNDTQARNKAASLSQKMYDNIDAVNSEKDQKPDDADA